MRRADFIMIEILMHITKILPFTPTAEAGDRAFFTFEEALKQKWTQENRLLFDAARKEMGYSD